MRSIELISIVETGLSEVWDAWTTESGVRGFLASECSVELSIGGPYKLLLESWAPELVRSSEASSVLAFVPERILSFSWNHMPEGLAVGGMKTWVVMEFNEMDDELCEVTLTHLGWGTGPEWETAYQYFNVFWSKVLERFERSVRIGHIDWETVSSS